MKKSYAEPEVDVILLRVEDVLSTSDNAPEEGWSARY